MSAGKFDSVYVSSFAPSRLPTDLERFDALIVPFDAGDGERTFQRACRGALKCRTLLPTIFCCAQKPDSKHLEWCRGRGVDRICDAADSHQMREEIRACLSDGTRHRLTPTADDVRQEKEEQRERERKLAERARPARHKKIFVGLVLVAVLLVLALAPTVAQYTHLPSSVVTMAASILGAYAVISAMKK